jgi:hypothetical protein
MNTPTPFNAEERAHWASTLTPRQQAWAPRADGTHLLSMWERRCVASGAWTHQRAGERRPDFSYVELSGGTHDIVDEQPEAVGRSILEFVLAQELW